MRESLVELISIYTIGLAGWFSIISGFFGHIFYADEVTTGIGWPINSGFQMELAFAAIGIGLVGFLGIWKQDFWLPFIIPKTTFMWGAGLTHILHMIQENNFSPSNTGIVVYWDFLLPVLLIILYGLFRKENPR
ncbi:MAG: stearoyl-CoA 9-desaturase [Anaerolineales bacterium]|nr:MAG: stearoyl-CoA 9-desaturase [Anaerolineales bacterium]